MTAVSFDLTRTVEIVDKVMVFPVCKDGFAPALANLLCIKRTSFTSVTVIHRPERQIQRPRLRSGSPVQTSVDPKDTSQRRGSAAHGRYRLGAPDTFTQSA